MSKKYNPGDLVYSPTEYDYIAYAEVPVYVVVEDFGEHVVVSEGEGRYKSIPKRLIIPIQERIIHKRYEDDSIFEESIYWDLKKLEEQENDNSSESNEDSEEDYADVADNEYSPSDEQQQDTTEHIEEKLSEVFDNFFNNIKKADGNNSLLTENDNSRYNHPSYYGKTINDRVEEEKSNIGERFKEDYPELEELMEEYKKRMEASKDYVKSNVLRPLSQVVKSQKRKLYDAKKDFEEYLRRKENDAE